MMWIYPPDDGVMKIYCMDYAGCVDCSLLEKTEQDLSYSKQCQKPLLYVALDIAFVIIKALSENIFRES